VAGVICVDASVALLWLIPDKQSAAATRLRRHCNREGVLMIAPPLFRAEVTSAITRWLYTRSIDEASARDAIRRSLRFRVDIAGDFDALQLRAFDIAAALNRPRAYDTQYLALAEFRECDLWTADERFVNAARREFPIARFIGDFPA
jgi:predicted nucleic acid-binding protein